ncbi:MAG: tyrosine-type recombinase/integrase [Planctomycetota bacterium]
MGVYKDKKYGRLRIQYTDWTGVRRTLTPSKESTEKAAEKLFHKIQSEHDDIRTGVKPPPKVAAKKLFADSVHDYVTWGNAQGGKGGRAWSDVQQHATPRILKFWQERLGLKMLADVEHIHSRVEKALLEIQSHGVGRKYRSGKVICKPLMGKTLNHYLGTLKAFCSWCYNRKLLVENPLDGLAKFDGTPKTIRRALTADEVQRLLSVCEPERALVYELAICSGLRVNELRSLTGQHLDSVRCGITLNEEWTKNRKSGFQPLPSGLVARLVSACANKDVTTSLLAVSPKHAARCLERDMKRAGIPKWSPGGKVDFHSLRVTYTTLALDSGANAKEAQSLARHATPNLTMNIYARARDERLAELAESIGQKVVPTILEYRIAVGAEQDGKCIKVAEALNSNLAKPVATEIKQDRVSNSNPFTRSRFNNFSLNNLCE